MAESNEVYREATTRRQRRQAKSLDFRRQLQNQGLYREIVTELFPTKLQLSTLLDVFKAFMAQITCADLDQNGTENWSRNDYFAYGQHRWCGNISFECFSDSGCGMVKFTNIRLPIDGNLNTQKCLKEPRSKACMLVECDEVTNLLAAYVEALGLETFVAEIVPTDRLTDGLFQVKIWNATKTNCYSINYEYGSFESNLVQPAYNMQLIRDRLAARKVEG